MAQPDAVLQGILNGLQLAALYNAAYLQGTPDVPRQWMLPPALDSLSSINITTAFDRKNANIDSITATQQGATAGELAAYDLQLGKLGSLERSFRIRHQTPARALAHVSGRNMGHGNGLGIHARLLGYLQDLLQTGVKQA